MIKIGVTGLVASGKTTVTNILSKGIYPIFNADKEVSKIYKNKSFHAKICKVFVFNNKKNIRRKIKKLVIQDIKNLRSLEKIIHPVIRKRLKNFIKKNKKKKILIFEIPLLIESRLMNNFNEIIFVNSKKKLRLKRFLKREKNKKIFDILNKRQFSPSKKIKFSDYVINNNNSLKKLKKNVKIIQKKL